MTYENLLFPPLEYLESSEQHRENYVTKLYNEHYIYSVQLFENKDFFVSLFNVEKVAILVYMIKIEIKAFIFIEKHI